MPSPATARWLLVATAVLFSTGGGAIKACQFDAFTIAAFRSAIAALLLLAIAPPSRHLRSLRPWVVAIGYAATMVLFVNANKLTTAANTIYLQSTAPLYLVLLAPLLLAERPSRADLQTLPLFLAAVVCCFLGAEQPQESAPQPLLGNVLAVCSGVCWALTLIGLRSMARQPHGAWPAVVAGNVVACLMAAPGAFPLGPHGPVDWLVVVYLGLFQIGIAYACMSHALPAVPAFEAALILLIEPVLNPFWAFVIEGETPSVWSIGGGVLILVGLAVRARL